MKWIVIPDMQVPDHDPKAVRALLDFIRHVKPDGLLCVGDECDSPEPSRWNKGYAGEFAGTLQKGLDTTSEILGEFRAALGKKGEFALSRSNHGERIQKYVGRYAPALASLRALDYRTLLRLDEHGIDYHEEPYEFAPGWVLAHGDEGSLVRTPGGTAMGLARRWGKSVVCGHTHRAGLMHDHNYLNGKPSRLLYGLEVGHLMSMKKASYLAAGSANWQQATALIEVDGKRVDPRLILINDGRIAAC